LWFDIARALHMSVARAKRETTSTQFLMWKVKFQQEWNEKSKTDHYLAQIAYEIHLLRVAWTGCSQKPPDDFLITFDFRKPIPKEEEIVEYVFEPLEQYYHEQQIKPELTVEQEEERERRARQSEAFWLRLFGGFSAGGKVKTQKPPPQPPKKPSKGK
jgi:hypothetical protein